MLLDFVVRKSLLGYQNKVNILRSAVWCTKIVFLVLHIKVFTACILSNETEVFQFQLYHCNRPDQIILSHLQLILFQQYFTLCDKCGNNRILCTLFNYVDLYSAWIYSITCLDGIKMVRNDKKSFENKFLGVCVRWIKLVLVGYINSLWINFWMNDVSHWYHVTMLQF